VPDFLSPLSAEHGLGSEGTRRIVGQKKDGLIPGREGKGPFSNLRGLETPGACRVQALEGRLRAQIEDAGKGAHARQSRAPWVARSSNQRLAPLLLIKVAA